MKERKGKERKRKGEQKERRKKPSLVVIKPFSFLLSNGNARGVVIKKRKRGA